MTREESIAFYKEHARWLFNISLRIVREPALAEEIMQDTILKALRQTHGPEGNRKLPERAWLAKTCIRASIDALRRIKRERLFLDEYASDGAPEYFSPADSDIPEERLSVNKIKAAIESLSDPYRLILNLILIEGLDYEEISSITGEREGTLRTQYSRARKMLAAKLLAGQEDK